MPQLIDVNRSNYDKVPESFNTVNCLGENSQKKRPEGIFEEEHLVGQGASQSWPV